MSFRVVFSPSAISPGQLHLEADVGSQTGTGGNRLDQRLFFTFWSEEGETFHGFGESFTDFDMSGRRIPVLVSEQGVGRGLEPITSIENSKTEGVGGHWVSLSTCICYQCDNNLIVVLTCLLSTRLTVRNLCISQTSTEACYLKTLRFSILT